ncbi:MAG: hypothetical protein ACFFG0_02290 [Candidatus Thorarchaeota archaeon]
MATGDIIGASIGTDGYTISITYEGMSSSGTHDLGLGSDNNPSTANIVLSLTSEGYDNTGTLGTTSRTIYGVPCTYPNLGAMRKADPNDASPDETVSGSDLIVRYALSEFIHNDDTAITVDVAAATYNDGSNDNNVATDYSVTNNSTLDYPRVIGNWAVSQNQLIIGTTVHLEFVAFHKYVTSGNPIACIKFTIEDASTNSVNTTVTSMSISSDSPLGKICTYEADINVSTLNDNEILTATAIAYPWVGDADSILDTSDAVNSMPTPLYTDLTMRLDKGGDHGYTVVDPTNGNDGTGTVYSSQSAAEAGSAFLTHAAALTALQTYNNTYAGHNDAGGGTLLLTEDTHSINTGNGGTMDTWVILKPISTATKANVLVQASTTNASMPSKMKLDGVTIQGTGWWYATASKYGWFYDCNVTATGTLILYDFAYGVAQNCTGAFPYQFKQFSTSKSNWAILRGNNVSSFHESKGWTILGNNNVGVSQRGNTGIPLNDNGVYAYNTTDDAVTSTMISLASSEDYTHGFAIVQNLLVRYGSQTEPMMLLSGDGTTTSTNNFFICNNTIAGARVNFGYNDTATGGPYPQTNWTIKNNIFSNWNNKDDTFQNNSSATGSWPVGYKVGGSGNHFRTTAADEWLGEFKGLYMKAGTGTTPLEPGYVDDQSADGGDTSGGDYHLSSSSPSLGLCHEQILPFDLDGRARVSIDNPGAWTYKEVTGSNWFYNKMCGVM